jgi:TrpR-related protein YerC/YecD
MVVMHTRGGSKLSSQERKELFLDLCRAIAMLQNPKEVADALTDLLSAKEVETIGKRLQIAAYLVEGKDYQTIRSILKVGYSTIARVNTWLNLSGEGFKIMLSRKKKPKKDINIEDRFDPYSWHNIKRRYSMYFWPELLFEEFMKRADKKEKEKMHKIFEKMDLKKRRFSGEENKKLYDMFSSEFSKPRKAS